MRLFNPHAPVGRHCKHFKKLSIITGIQIADELRKRVKEGLARVRAEQWRDFTWHANVSFWNAANMDNLDTIK